MDILTSLPDSLDALGAFVGQLQLLIGMGLAHPVWAIGLLLLSIGVLQLAADLVKRGLKGTLRFLLWLPIGGSQWAWRRLRMDVSDNRDQVSVLLDRLEALRAEETEVLAELKRLVGKVEQRSEEASAEMPTDP